MKNKYYIILPENKDFIEKTIDFIQTEVCPLTNSEECIEAVKGYEIHENPLKMVDDVFNVLMKCDKTFCVHNKEGVKKRLEDYIEKNVEKST